MGVDNTAPPSLLDSQVVDGDDWAWFVSTKEQLIPADVLSGLIDHGLFADRIPPCFTSKGLTDIVLATMGGVLDDVANEKTKKEIDKRAHDYLRYEALRDINIPRHIGIPHPESYAVQALAISKYWKEIAVHSNQPTPVASRIHVRQVGGGCIFKMNYSGAERFQFEEEELQWMRDARFLVEADIALCFPSIYSHAIPWAMHGKAESKNSSNAAAQIGDLLDRCTRNTRDKQTNGLLIGPHASNIISEIILTKIDTELQKKGYKTFVRHVDDFMFFARTFEQAEAFIKELGFNLRTFEMSLNEKKTRILLLPRPSDENWRLALNRFQFPESEEIRFSVIRSFLDLALECAQSAGKSSPLNYAIKVLASVQDHDGTEQATVSVPRKLNLRAKRMYSQEAMNLTLAYPYLAPLLDEFVFDKYWYDGLKTKIAEFSTSLVRLGIRKLYPDTIAHALYFALKHAVTVDLTDDELVEIVALDDCIANVLLIEYATLTGREKVAMAVKSRAGALKNGDIREMDKHWLLIYQVWSQNELAGNVQGFLATLKNKGFQFFSMPVCVESKVLTVDAPDEQQHN